jgi:hypothetical protein
MRSERPYLVPPSACGYWLAAGCLLWIAASAALGFHAYRSHRDAGAHKALASSLAVATRRHLPAQPTPAQLEQARRWKSLEAERSFAWYPVFAALENSSAADIELLEFQPDKAGRTLVLHGEAQQVDALLAYIERLSAEPVFHDVELTHESPKVRERLITVAFEIRATLRE